MSAKIECTRVRMENHAKGSMSDGAVCEGVIISPVQKRM